MRFDILTLFPGMFAQFLETSIVGRAVKAQAIDVNLVDFRHYTTDRHRTVDDYPYGGGAGMVLKPEPIAKALDNLSYPKSTPVVYFTPQGKVLNQQMVHRFAGYQQTVLLCGHYKELDQRVRDTYVTEEISLGDYVISGGELAAMVFVDALARLCDGVLGDMESALGDSFADGLLGCPHYTRPAEFRGQKVPQVLLNGNHAHIEEWRRQKSWELTKKVRPDLLTKDFNNEG